MSRSCKRCGQCCKEFYFEYSKKEILDNIVKSIKRGHIDEIVKNAQYLSMIKWSKRKVPSGQWVVSCKLYDEKEGCTIHEHKPLMCKDYPYGMKGVNKGCGYKGRKRKGD